mgnify:CR=1 FL=1
MQRFLQLVLWAACFLGAVNVYTHQTATGCPSTSGEPARVSSASTITWTGAINTDWHNVGNWSPAQIPQKGSLSGDDVIIPVVSSGNYPVVSAAAGARSVVIALGASLTVDLSGNLEVQGSPGTGLFNAGMLDNSGVLRVDTAMRHGIQNQSGASILNSGTLIATETDSLRLLNRGLVNNSGSVLLDQGAWQGLHNLSGASILNQADATFTVQNGLSTRVFNAGKIDNYGAFRALGGLAGANLINTDTILNRANATFQVTKGAGRCVDNSGYICNAGQFTAGSSSNDMVNSAVLNQVGGRIEVKQGASFSVSQCKETLFRNEGQFESAGTTTLSSSPRSGLVNAASGKILNTGSLSVSGTVNMLFLNEGEFRHEGDDAKITLSGSGSNGLVNSGKFISTAGCSIQISAISFNLIRNEPGAIFENSCQTVLGTSGNPNLSNQGRYLHLSGELQFNNGSLRNILNSGYCELNIPIKITAGGTFAENSDTLIMGTACDFGFAQGYGSFIQNVGSNAYLFFDGKVRVANMGAVFNNSGKAILGSNSVLSGRNVHNPMLNSGHLDLQGSVSFRAFGVALSNSGTLHHSGSFKAANSMRSIINDGGELFNSGDIQIDSVSQSGLLCQGAHTLENEATGSISINFCYDHGLHNAAGLFENNGDITIGARDTIGKVGLLNLGNFRNNNSITIGGDGGKFGVAALSNDTTGDFLNRSYLVIDDGNSASNPIGLENKEQFTNDYCREIDLKGFVSNTGEFDNYGIIHIDSDKSHTNTGTFTNYEGQISYVQTEQIPNVMEKVDPDALTCPETQFVNPDNSPLDLTTIGASPAGGVFSGDGVDSNTGTFDPQNANNGANMLAYEYTYYDGCVKSCEFTVLVNCTVSGHIQWIGDASLGVKDVSVELSGALTDMTSTDVDGQYQFFYAPSSTGSVTITPGKTINPLNGVNVADVLAIQKHAAKIDPITDPLLEIAADVNQNNIVSSQDAAILSQALKLNAAALAILSNQSWRFVDANWSPVSPPWGFPQQIESTLDEDDCEVTNVDFVGIKKGDVVDANADPSLKPETNMRVIRLLADDRKLTKGEIVQVAVSAVNFKSLAAMQFALRFDTEVLRFQDAEGLQFLPSGSFGKFTADQGEIRTVWTDLTPRSASVRTPLFRLTFEVLQQDIQLSNALYLDEQSMLTPAVFGFDLEAYPVEWVWRPEYSLSREANHQALNAHELTARPNPFTHTFVVGFDLAEDDLVAVRLLDMQGKIVAQQSALMAKGYHEVPFVESAKLPDGLYYCELITAQGVQSQRVVKTQ